eukprot:112519_1
MPSKLIKLAASIAAISTLMVTSADSTDINVHKTKAAPKPLMVTLTDLPMVDSNDLFIVRKTEAAPEPLTGTWLEASSSKKLDVYDLLCHAGEASDLLREGLTEEDAQLAMYLINKWKVGVKVGVHQPEEAPDRRKSGVIRDETSTQTPRFVDDVYPTLFGDLLHLPQEKIQESADDIVHKNEILEEINEKTKKMVPYEKDIIKKVDNRFEEEIKTLNGMIRKVVEKKYPQANYWLKRIQQERNGAVDVDLDQSKSESSVVSTKKVLKA